MQHKYVPKFPRILLILVVLGIVVPSSVNANDTLYFRMVNCIQGSKGADGKYVRKAIHTKDSGWLALDYDDSSRLLMRSYYADTNFHTKILPLYIYSAKKKYCVYVRSYKNGKLEGISAEFDEKGDTLWKQNFKGGKMISSWISPNYGHKEIVYAPTEFDAEYPGGPSRWSYYLSKNLKYPKYAQQKEIMGTVLVLFVVSSEGEVTDVEVIQSVHSSLDEEAMRLIKASPKWKAATWDGIKVAQYKAQPVVFRLE